MTGPTRVLIVEDSADDAELDVHTLRAAGFRVEWRRVETEPAYLEALDWPPQIILSDCTMPRFSATHALQHLRARGFDIPFIVVSGTVGEDTAASLMKAGAQDYVLKANLSRLAPAVERELREVEIRRAEREARTSLQESEARYRRIVETAEEGIWMIDADNRTTFVNGKMAEMLGCTVEEMLGRSMFDFMDRDDRKLAERNVERRRSGVREQHDFRLRRIDGSYLWTLMSTTPVHDQQRGYRGALAMVTDITQRKQAEEALRERELLLQAIFDTEPECVKLLSADGHFVQMNPAGLAMLEADHPDQVLGKEALSVIAPEHRPAFGALTRDVLRGGSGTLEFEVIGLKGSRRWLETHAVPLQISGSRMLLGITRDITGRKRAEQQLDYLANHDTLTGLPNRTLFLDRLQRALIDAERHGRHVGVVTLDIARFKTINDSLGHESGDLLLRAVAERLSETTRKGDTVARLGADEFALVLADMASPNDLPRVAQMILDAFERPYQLEGQEIYLSVVMGIAQFPGDARTVAGLMRAAEIARHRAKEQDEKRWQFYSRDMSEAADATLMLERGLRQALERRQFRLHYQPVVDTRSRRVLGVEALVRWQHPERGMVSPMEFIPIAEEAGLIVPIGAWVLREACLQLCAWQAAGWRDLHVAVNVSAIQFARADFVDTVREVLMETRLEPRSLVLELTESTLMNSSEELHEKLTALRALGTSLSLDDFGTGYSSFGYLKRMPIDTLKIDRTFVSGVPAASDSNTIIDAIVKMAHALGKRVVAEGVENESQFLYLKACGTDAVQGYLLGRPMDADSLLRWLPDQQKSE